MEMIPPGRRRRGRPKLRLMDCVNRDMRAIEATVDEVHAKSGWRKIVSAAATRQLSGSGLKKKKNEWNEEQGNMKYAEVSRMNKYVYFRHIK